MVSGARENDAIDIRNTDSSHLSECRMARVLAVPSYRSSLHGKGGHL